MRSLCLSVLCCLLLAANARAQVSYGAEVGVNISKYHGKSLGVAQTGTTAVVAPRIGILANVPLADHLALQPGLSYTNNGYKTSLYDLAGNTYPITVKTNCLELPINVLYMTGRSDGNRFFVGAGPYITMNLSGYVQSSVPIFNGTLNIGGNTNDDIKRIDIGGGASIGYLLAAGMFVHLHIQNSITNMQPQGDANNTIRNMSYGITVGYTVKGHKKQATTKPAPAKR